jgi:hypothetical protein
MEFTSANPSVVRSVKQRDLLNAWLRAFGKSRALPIVADYRPDRIDDELAEMMGYNVEGDGCDTRFMITQAGARLSKTYGSEHLDPDQRINRYLDDALGPERYARVIPSYRACVAHGRPSYSISMVRDADGKDVSFERLLLPFGTAGKVEQIVGSFKAISIEGGFQVSNLMGIKAPTTPVCVVRAVIDHDFVPGAAVHGASDDVIELS